MLSIAITKTSQPGGRLRREGLLKRVWVESAGKRTAEIWGQEQKKAGSRLLWRLQDRGFLLRMRRDGRMQPPGVQGTARGGVRGTGFNCQVEWASTIHHFIGELQTECCFVLSQPTEMLPFNFMNFADDE